MLTRPRFAALIVLLSFAAFPAAAQEFSPAILPADTSFVIFSRGTAHAEVIYPTNPMIQSWNSPDFADFRQQAIAYVIRHADWKVNGRPVKFAPAEAEQIFSFLKSPMMIGLSGPIDVGSLTKDGAPSAKQLMNVSGMFAIVDVTGKTAQFDFLFKFIGSNLPKEITRTHTDFSGVSIEKFVGPNNTSFATRVGNYFVWSNQQKVIQDLVSRLGSRSAPADSLGQNANFQHCHATPDPDSVYEMFLRIPDFTKTSVPASAQFDTSAALRSLKLDSLHAVCGSVGLTQQGEHSRGLFLGDTTAGGVFDFLGANRAHFDTVAFAPQTAYSYFGYSFDLPAIYKTVRAAAMNALPPQQTSMVQMVEGMVGMQVGMPVNDVLALVGGEAASIQFDPNTNPPSGMYAITISNPEKVMVLMNKFGANSFVEDSHDNGITLFKSKITPAVPGTSDPAPTTYVAITPHFLFYGTDKKALLKAAQSGSATGGASLAEKPEISKLRALLPRELLGLSITDYSRYDWAAQLTKSIDQSENSDAAKLSPEDIQFFETMKKFNATALGKAMLHSSVDGWWKDADGIHYEGFDQ
jgi:hypothetical protein